MRIVRDRSTAEDGVVEAFWRAYRARATFDATRSFGAWMRRVATNVALDSLRAARPSAGRTVEPDSLVAPPAGDPAVRESIELALARLSPKLRVVAILALIEDRPYDEIADALDVPIGTVKSRVFRATRELRRELTRLGITP
jgi:RNA polymerase sigma-70 factor (ECF subfamily)